MTFSGPVPFDQAIAYVQAKGLLPTNLSSFQISQLRRQLKQRSIFSARMDKADVLQVIQENLEQLVGGMGIEEENGRLRSIPEAKSQLREALVKAGVPFAEPGREGKITDFYSNKRRSLIVRTNLLDMLGAGQQRGRQNRVALDINPGLELVRTIVPKGGIPAERDWNQRWKDALSDLGLAGETGCTDPDEAGGRMVALVNHPIWQALGDGAGGYTDCLGNAWEPFAFSSGMTREPVPRGECIELGIMTEDQDVEPDDSLDLNGGLQANAKRFSQALQTELASGGLEIIDGVLRLIENRERRRKKVLLNSFDPNEARDEKGKWTGDGTLHHTVDFDSEDERQAFLANLKKGKNRLNADERLDVSETPGKASAPAHAVHLQIDSHAKALKDEEGIHFAPGTSFKASSIEENADGSKTVHLAEMGMSKAKPPIDSEAPRISSAQAARNVSAGKDPELEKACRDWVCRSGSHVGVGFDELNKHPNSPDAQRVLTQFSKLENYKSDEPVYRAMCFSNPKQRDAFLEKVAVGQKFPVRGIAMSASKDQDIARTFAPFNREMGNFSNNRIHIEIQGSTARDLSSILDKKDFQILKQKEVVFLSGSQFQVVSIQKKNTSNTWGRSIRDSNGRRIDTGSYGAVNAPWDSVSKIVLKQIL